MFRIVIFLVLLYLVSVGGNLKSLDSFEYLVVNVFILGLFVIYFFLKKPKKIITLLDVPIFFLLIIHLWVFIVNRNWTAFSSNYFWILVYIFVYYFVIAFAREEIKIREVLFILILISGICSIWGIIQIIYLIERNIFDVKISGVWSFLNNPNIFANYLIMILPINIALYFLKGNKYLLFNLFLVILSLIFTLSRTGYFILLCQIITLYFFIFRRKFLLILIISVTLITPIVYLTLTKRYEPRFDIWKDTLSMIKDKPLSGFGHNGWSNYFLFYKSKNTELHNHSHNLFLQIATCGGFIYLFSYLWVFISYIKYFFKSRKSLLNICLAISIFSFLIHNIFDYFLNVPILGIMFFIILGLSINYSGKNLVK